VVARTEVGEEEAPLAAAIGSGGGNGGRNNERAVERRITALVCRKTTSKENNITD